jgi:hypothetical protein
MIAPEAGLSVIRQCALLGIARSSFYYRPRPESPEELELLKRLDRIFTDHPVYGSRRSGCGRSGRNGTPASGIPSTRSTRTFCAARRSTSRTRCGQPT